MWGFFSTVDPTGLNQITIMQEKEVISHDSLQINSVAHPRQYVNHGYILNS